MGSWKKKKVDYDNEAILILYQADVAERATAQFSPSSQVFFPLRKPTILNYNAIKFCPNL
jgi:hypothetical protein